MVNYTLVWNIRSCGKILESINFKQMGLFIDCLGPTFSDISRIISQRALDSYLITKDREEQRKKQYQRVDN